MIEKMLFCDGSHGEIGRKQGELLSAEIRHNLTAFWKELKKQGRQKKAILRNALKHEQLWRASRLEEIEGMARGVKLPYPELLAYNVFHDVVFPEGCTVMMAVGKTGANGNTVFFKQSDKVGSEKYVGPLAYLNKEINIAIATEPKGANKTIGVTAAGQTALKMGMNDKGVAAGCNISRTKELTQRGTEKDATQLKALDRGALMRDGLEAGNTAIEAAQTILPGLLASPMSTPGNIEFADAKEAVIIEGSYSEMATEIVRDAVAARSNRFVILKELARDDDLSSICRYVRCLELLHANKGKVTLEKMIEFSQDHANGPGPNSICRHGNHFSEETSLSSMVMEINAEEPLKSRIAIALGKPCHSWTSKDGHLIADMTLKSEDIPEGLRTGEHWKKYYTEEPKR